MAAPQLATHGTPWKIAGKLTNPRFVWLVDRVFADAISNPASFGFKATDQVVYFPDGSFDTVTKFLKTKTAEFSGASAIIFLELGLEKSIDLGVLVADALPLAGRLRRRR